MQFVGFWVQQIASVFGKSHFIGTLDGNIGTGKSLLLTHILHYGHTSGQLLVHIPWGIGANDAQSSAVSLPSLFHYSAQLVQEVERSSTVYYTTRQI